MCATCGCSDPSGVRIVDPATGESVPVPSGSGAHEHVDEQGRVYTHTHEPEPAEEPA